MAAWLTSIGDELRPVWAVILLVAVPVAGLVGFVFNIATLQKTRLENKRLAEELSRSELVATKLSLEVGSLARAAKRDEEKEADSQRVIQLANLVEMAREVQALRVAESAIAMKRRVQEERRAEAPRREEELRRAEAKRREQELRRAETPRREEEVRRAETPRAEQELRRAEAPRANESDESDDHKEQVRRRRLLEARVADEVLRQELERANLEKEREFLETIKRSLKC